MRAQIASRSIELRGPYAVCIPLVRAACACLYTPHDSQPANVEKPRIGEAGGHVGRLQVHKESLPLSLLCIPLQYSTAADPYGKQARANGHATLHEFRIDLSSQRAAAHETVVSLVHKDLCCACLKQSLLK